MPEIVIDLTQVESYLKAFFNFVLSFGELPFPIMFLKLMLYFGWLYLGVILLWGLKFWYLSKMAGKYEGRQRYICLAIDIPQNNEQTPKAFENIFNHLAGAHSSIWWFDKYRNGDFQQNISMEIVSIEGHIQFLVRCNANHRDVVEAAIFAQYPEAVITEINDYVNEVPATFPNPTHDLWGVEFIPVKKDIYPIKVYRQFGDELTQEYKDPMAAFLENLTRIGQGEQIWFQIIIVPISQEWSVRGAKEVNAILGKKEKSKKTFLDKVVDAPLNLLMAISDLFFGKREGVAAPEEKGLKMMDLPPGQVNMIKAIEEKCAKIGYETMIRLVYIARHEVFSKPRVVYPLIGAIKQFNSQDLNSLKPDFKEIGVGGNFLFAYRKNKVLNQRRRRLMYGYKNRYVDVGNKTYILNSEELASLYHFPLMMVKAASLKKIEIKTAPPPINLPDVAESEKLEKLYEKDKKVKSVMPEEPVKIQKTIKKTKVKTKEAEAPPAVFESFDLDDDYFEKKFALQKDRDKQKTKTVESKAGRLSEPDTVASVKNLSEEKTKNTSKTDTDETRNSPKAEPPANLPIG